jgi:molecular chaperone DnaJ
MTYDNYYQILEVHREATPREIKQAYRRLAKRFHPDSQLEPSNSEKIVQINAAYEVLRDPQRRYLYDRQFSFTTSDPALRRRQQRTTAAQQSYQRHRQAEQAVDMHLQQWLREVYRPLNRLICLILNPLNSQIDNLAADPFDDQLMHIFQEYLGDCRHYLAQARLIFASQPNPAQFAHAAASFYYCLNQMGDGIDELEWFTLNYDDRHLHTGQELFRIARRLRLDAQATLKDFV